MTAERPSARDVARKFFGCVEPGSRAALTSPDHTTACDYSWRKDGNYGCDRLARLIEREREGAQTPPMEGQLEHTRSCSVPGGGEDAECTCGLEWRIRLQTEQTMRAAWEKRAYQAERELAEHPGIGCKDDHAAVNRVWEALGIRTYTGKHIADHVQELRASAAASESRCAELEREIASAHEDRVRTTKQLALANEGISRQEQEIINLKRTVRHANDTADAEIKRAEQAEAERERLRQACEKAIACLRPDWSGAEDDAVTLLRAALQGREAAAPLASHKFKVPARGYINCVDCDRPLSEHDPAAQEDPDA